MLVPGEVKRRWDAGLVFGVKAQEELLPPAGLLFLPWPSLRGLGVCCWDSYWLLWAGIYTYDLCKACCGRLYTYHGVIGGNNVRIHVIKVPKFIGSILMGLLQVFHRGE